MDARITQGPRCGYHREHRHAGLLPGDLSFLTVSWLSDACSVLWHDDARLSCLE